MHRKYDIIAIDLDGTLLNERGEVSSINMAAIERALAAGMTVVVCTGRGYIEAAHVIEPLNLSGPAIVAGGAMVVDAATGRTLTRSAMDFDLVCRLSKRLNEATGHLVLLLKDRCLTGYDYLLTGAGRVDVASEWWFQQVPVITNELETAELDPHPHDTVRLGVVTTIEAMRDLKVEIEREYRDETLVHHFPIISGDANGNREKSGSIHLLEVFRPDTTKWSALERMAKELEISPLRVAAIGDEINDIEMLRRAGLGIAMGNASPGVMHVADRVTESNREDGVAHAIDRILTGEW